MPLQKSYSERIGLSKRSPWQRSRSNPVNQNYKLPPVAEVTKQKLSKFQCQALEDETPASPMDDTVLPSKETATTPANRLTWRDFMEPSDTTVETDEHTSPNERIGWDSKPDTLYANALSPLLARRKGKRARSSSPISSPGHEKPTTPAVNVKELAQALKSPHADPTLELWDRYALNKNESHTTPLGLANPALAQLMVSSSPRTSRESGKAQPNLRRAMSYGLHGSKRRKIEKKNSCGGTTTSQEEMEAASKSMLVNSLLDTMNSSMQTPSPAGSSSKVNPADATPKAAQHLPQSPTARKTRRSPTKTVPSQAQIALDVFSDYGDDDFDDETFMELEASLTQAPRVDAPVVKDNATLDEFGDLEDDDLDDATLLLATQAMKEETPSPKKAKPQANSLSMAGPHILDEDFGDLDDDPDFDAVMEAATQSVEKAQSPNSHILVIRADGGKVDRTVHLRGCWYDTPAHADSYVHVIGDFSYKGQCIVDDAENLLILHPDQLISSTVVADSFGCMRRAVLQDRVKATSEASPPLVYGTMLHEIFQDALLANQWDRLFLYKVIQQTCEKHVEDLYTINVSIEVAREHLNSKMDEVTQWASAFVTSNPVPDAIVEDRGGRTANMAVTKLLDVEEHVWSPMYGLKGNIDATVEVAMLDGKDKRMLTVPFEVKTGKHPNPNHMAQTALYTLLLSDRYDIDIAYGILYYMETSKTMRIPAVRHELRHMVMQRNQLACYVRERNVRLPPMLKHKHMCGKCYAKTSCFTYHRLADDGDGETSGMGEKFDELVKHLTPQHQAFFIKWENLLTIEEKDGQKTKRELWTMTSAEREKKSRCFADVIIKEGSGSVDTDNPRINRFHYTFIKRLQQPAGFSFTESELNVGEPIVVSDEEGHFALAIGYVTAVKKQSIKVAVDRRLHNARIRQPGFDEANNQVFASIMEVAPEGSAPQDTQGKIKQDPIRYRLDKDEFSNGMATIRNNLVQMMANDIPEASKIRSLIVDLKTPSFKSAPTQYAVTDGESLNTDQKRAIEKVMSAQDYALVLGMPGTGKTTTIAHIIRALVSQGKQVLLTSHTHTAVDNILLKLKMDNIPVLRLGAPAKVHPGVQEFAHLAGVPKKSFDEIDEAWMRPPVVATTCLGINHHIFQKRAFDYCIVDEASQITLPICAGPIRMARTFILVGDHNQLPPVVRNEEAREGGLDVSLFKLLSDAHPQSVVNLEHQYRMCEDIMTLSNTLIYDGRLRCGTEALKKRKLEVPDMAALSQRHHDVSTLATASVRSFCTVPSRYQCWLRDLLEPENRVVFVNTDTLEPAVHEEAQGKRIVNPGEARIVQQLVDSFLAVGIAPDEVGVMTHYRAQLFLLKEQLRHYGGVEMHTTDRFQGRDKEVIVLSLVRSNDSCSIGDLLKDWRRINVAFTRAKTKLIVVGSKKTLKNSGDETMLSRFIRLMEESNWIYDLPKDAMESHYFPDFATQITATGPTQRIPKTPGKGRTPPRKAQGAGGKENKRPTPRKGTMPADVLFKDKPITRYIMHETTNGAY
ncbi:DNA replication ATP-dependent helicase/nuclease-like protein [Emericellopsis cladophorae]|uniref:DNA replication ATP-dependent helicase/nuclease n=1 Tax=Emericellopsis cladophorae TaxID=2686198 RepID=A0A9P9Y6M2_9HYPO|nr:DNA replication ATP-dependent helicase/nuclease-like protein [Emericellopsis cladophorae]KAI6784248.1 DNA replication ATP-dependent helicase/nuclease-like protein [Emericellopsis cladophorae]